MTIRRTNKYKGLGGLCINADDVKEIVKLTIMELAAADMLKDSYEITRKNVTKRLQDFFITGKDKAVKKALHELSDDPYIDIIFLQYRDDKTLEWVAEALDRDVSTIKRNKKRLIKDISRLLDM